MKKRFSLLLLALAATFILWHCENLNDSSGGDGAIEEQILALLASEDSLYELDDFDNTDQMDFGLGKGIANLQMVPGPFDSAAVWRFWRTGMARQRLEPEITVENDSLAYARLTDQITGTFHVLQRERVWTDDTTWTVGDTVGYSEKPIQMVLGRKVRFEYLPNPANEYHWHRTGMTPLYGGSVDGTIDFVRLVLTNLVTDSSRVLSDFENHYISMLRQPLAFARGDTARADLFVLNGDSALPEWVRYKWDFHHFRPVPPAREIMRYTGTNDDGEKRYTRIFELRGRDRVFKAYVEAVDARTLFDHSYTTYHSQILGFHYRGGPPRHP
ncbi:MAG: hypothetical protein K9N11_02890 [Lentisphaeria bacterium]|nr:hypothetical protein [Candidatus Neomarinimicrobiota bacterium]MCF7841778.1 hypothetical protein [Lentisphaeria bacterium]